MRRIFPHSKRHGFTLAELLVVMIIIGIMFIVALPAFMNIAGPSKLDAAAGALQAAIKLARQHAIANSQPTYLVFHTDASTDDPNLAFRSYAVFTIDTHKPNVSQADGTFITDWETLPAGLVFDAQSAQSENLFIPTSASWNGGLSQNNRLYIDGVTYSVIGFIPRGKTTTFPYWTRRLLLTEGTYIDGMLRHTSVQGKEVRLERHGNSSIVDVLYTDGELKEVSQ